MKRDESEPGLRRRAVAAAVALACLLALSVTALGCRGGEEGPAAGGDGEEGVMEGQIAAPGIYELSDGRVQAIGTLVRLELEGGFWALVDVPPGEEPSGEDTADVVAVIPNAEEVRPDIEDLFGEYVAVTGERVEGASIRMAGPEVMAESIEPVGPDVQVAPEAEETTE